MYGLGASSARQRMPVVEQLGSLPRSRPAKAYRKTGIVYAVR